MFAGWVNERVAAWPFIFFDYPNRRCEVSIEDQVVGSQTDSAAFKNTKPEDNRPLHSMNVTI